MKILVMGDIHGRPHWKDIVDKENADKIIFLGDYVSTHESYTQKEQIDNLENILQFKEANPDKVVLLRGNHDLGEMYDWAECYPYAGTDVTYYMCTNKERFLKNTQWLYIYNNIVFSHAGITEPWFKQICDKHNISSIEEINSLEPEPLFAFNPDNYFDGYGDSKTQSITWVRPQTLVEYAYKPEIYTYVVGHTTVGKINNTIDNGLSDTVKVWLCDCMPKEYLIIEDNEFRVRENDYSFGKKIK